MVRLVRVDNRPQNPMTPCRHTGFAWLQLPAGQSSAGLTHLQRATWGSSGFGPQTSSYCHGQREAVTDRIRTGVPEWAVGPHSRAAWFIVLPMYRAQRWHCRFRSAVTWHKRVPKMEPEMALSSQLCEVLHPLWRGLPPAAKSGRISRISAKNQACVHGSCIGPCSPGMFESVNITTCLLLPGLDHSGYAPISA